MSRLLNLSAKLTTLLIFTLLCVIVSFIAACKSGAQPAAKGGPPGGGGRGGGEGTGQPKSVKLVAAGDQILTQVVTATGTLAADEQASLSFRVAGRLAQLSIDLGSVVRKGQPIAKLETLDFKQRVDTAEASLQQARVRLGLAASGADDKVNAENTALVRQARALLEEARASRDRTTQLVNQGIISRAELDRVESTYKVAESRYQDAIEEVRNRQAVLLPTTVSMTVLL